MERMEQCPLLRSPMMILWATLSRVLSVSSYQQYNPTPYYSSFQQHRSDGNTPQAKSHTGRCYFMAINGVTCREITDGVLINSNHKHAASKEETNYDHASWVRQENPNIRISFLSVLHFSKEDINNGTKPQICIHLQQMNNFTSQSQYQVLKAFLFYPL